ncbi:MAG TPA: SDR family oxidoreductase [Vicinamibacterales bacterium]|nr:SDR family oxidoreductase [Vicinamibacterales bacterium]
MDLKLSGKVAVVTGASRGIGRAIAQTLANEGMKLTLAARSKEQLDELAASLETECLVQAVDLREPEAAPRVIDATMKKFGTIDLLVNNAGATKRGDFFELTDSDWADGFALKFFGAMRLSRAAWVPLSRSRGTIVNIIGVGGRTGNADFTIGGSVNAAGRLLTKALADRGVKDGVRVNAINPGFIKTERLTVRVRSFAEEHKLPLAEAETQLAKATGVARFGEPEEIAAAVAFLASPVCGFCHGSLLDIDGGQTRTL